ncbi:MAG: twin-arginine translocase subunit TatC [Candidatus Omnitrophica bacterium]|nr:twin-arginine translocase subunit TatC [Candidatus Omnitrophota bacterium]
MEKESPRPDALPFITHLEELRRRLLRSLGWVALGVAVAWVKSEALLSWLIEPVGKVVYLSPTEPFLLQLKVALWAGGVLACPFLAWEAWGFLSPGLLARERRWMAFLIPAGFGLFLLGGWLSFRFLVPVALGFLLRFGVESLTPMISAGHYFGFVIGLALAGGIMFQTPVVVLVLTQMGLVTPRTLLAQWRVAVVVILVASAVLTPTPDMASQLILSLPMTGLYFLSVALSYVTCRKN